MGENKRYKKSEKYKGVYQSKDGSWFYRIKKTFSDGRVEYYQQGNCQSELEAHKERISFLREIAYNANYPCYQEEDISTGEIVNVPVIGFHEFGTCESKSFQEVFQEFLSSGFVESESSQKKYQALYNAQLYVWADKEIHTFKNTDIDLFMLKLSIGGYKASYQASIRKLIKKIFEYVSLTDPMVPGDIAVGISTQPYKLRVLSLFSGIGAPEQALTDMGIDYELVNFCEIDKKAAKAYCLLHGAKPEQNLGDITKISDKIYAHRIGKIEIPDFDIMFFGFPCQDISKSGKQKGLSGERSKLFFDAMRIAYVKKPKLLIAENVSNLVSNKFRDDFWRIIEEFEDSGYKYYNRKVNANRFGLPQNRNRVFMVLVREDLGIDFEFPKGFPLDIKAEDWFEPVVDDEYYATPEQLELIRTTKNRKSNFNRDCITCITTGWGTPSYTQQTFVEDEKGVRCLSSEELMRFQGFTKEQGKMLRDAGFSKNQVGHMVGNSIAVPAIKAILESLFSQLCKVKQPTRYNYITDDTKEKESKYIQPLFAYMGNKSKLLDSLIPLMPKDLSNMNFVDLFAGVATVAINVNAKRILINDVSEFLIGIYKGLSDTPPEKGWRQVCDIVDKYHLDADSPEYYDQCRIEYNIQKANYTGNPWYWGLALVYHSFNRNTVKHSQLGNFNSSYGHQKCDMRIAQQRFFPFAEKIYNGNYELSNQDFRVAIPEDMNPKETFIYVDPPYRITTATYNEIWPDEQEIALYDFLDQCHERGFKWMLSNVTENKNQKNDILIDWIAKHQDEYHVYYLDRNYNSCSYNSRGTGKTVEVLITNYQE
ncbi:MAG: DNA (cytosine-5-)-methyltransferase [Parabacteroides sp.]|nr:DNA (cytosine-5-)-methyltransferase [Parabacteroides sp.]